MKKVAWLTDPHINKLKNKEFFELTTKILSHQPDVIFLTGDISEAPTLLEHLSKLEACLQLPIYFVLGNHDYHFANIEWVHEQIKNLCSKNKNLIWLTQKDYIQSSEGVAIVGHENWYDMSLGTAENFPILFQLDWSLIHDFNQLKKNHKKIKLTKHIAKKSTQEIIKNLDLAFSKNHTVHLLTHVPPWKEHYTGTIIDQGNQWLWLPYNVNHHLGQKLEELMSSFFPDKKLEVYSGHVHPKKMVKGKIQDNINFHIGIGASDSLNLEKILFI